MIDEGPLHVIKCEKHNPPKIVGKFLSRKTRFEYLLNKQNGYPEMLSLSQPLETFRQY